MNDETFRIKPVREKRQRSDDAKDVDVNDEYDANDVDDENDKDESSCRRRWKDDGREASKFLVALLR